MSVPQMLNHNNTSIDIPELLKILEQSIHDDEIRKNDVLLLCAALSDASRRICTYCKLVMKTPRQCENCHIIMPYNNLLARIESKKEFYRRHNPIVT